MPKQLLNLTKVSNATKNPMWKGYFGLETGFSVTVDHESYQASWAEQIQCRSVSDNSQLCLALSRTVLSWAKICPGQYSALSWTALSWTQNCPEKQLSWTRSYYPGQGSAWLGAIPDNAQLDAEQSWTAPQLEFKLKLTALSLRWRKIHTSFQNCFVMRIRRPSDWNYVNSLV